MHISFSKQDMRAVAIIKLFVDLFKPAYFFASFRKSMQ